MKVRTVIRRHTLTLSLLLALVGCGEPAPSEPEYLPADYSYLPRIKLDVATIEINDSWAPRGITGHLEQVAPLRPRDALSRMGNDRLLTGGNSGRALFSVEDATILRGRSTYDAHFAVGLAFFREGGDSLGGVKVEVSRSVSTRDESEAGRRVTLYKLVQDAMDDMNVELEFQLRRKMKDLLQTTSATAPEPGVVESEALDAPQKPSGVLKPVR